MKCSRMVLTLVLAFASTACVLLKTDERIDVVVAAADLGAGKTITDRDITITGIPVSSMTPDMPRKSSQVVGRTTKVAISKGDLIRLSELKWTNQPATAPQIYAVIIVPTHPTPRPRAQK